MIEPSYRRDQLWGRARRGIHPAIVLGACAGTLVAILAILALATVDFDLGDHSPRGRAVTTVANLVHERFPAWRTHHAGCPHRLAELSSNARVDPWGHAMHYTCDRRLRPGAHFTVISAGEDGVFGTADDIEAHQ
jgi:hypothetical protein